MLQPQHFAHLVHQLEFGIGDHRVRQRTHLRGLRAGNRKSIIFDMKLPDIGQEALGLGESERAELVLSLIRTLAAPTEDITDKEVFRRDAELETGRQNRCSTTSSRVGFEKSAGDEARVPSSRSARRQQDSKAL